MIAAPSGAQDRLATELLRWCVGHAIASENLAFANRLVRRSNMRRTGMLPHEEERIRKGEVQPCWTIDELMDVLRNFKRREALARLAHSAQSVSNLATAMDLDEGGLSYHLGKLWHHGLVEIEAIGSTHIYRLTAAVKASMEGTQIALACTAANGDQLTLRYHLSYLEGASRRKRTRGALAPRIISERQLPMLD